MKKASLLLLAVCFIMALSAGCSSHEKVYDVNLLADSLEDSGAFSDILSEVDIKIAAALYGFDEADVAESKLLCSTGATTEEIGIFKCVDKAAAARVLAFAQKRVESQRTAYESYAPAEMPKLDEAIVEQKGVYVFYIVSNDAEVAVGAIK